MCMIGVTCNSASVNDWSTMMFIESHYDFKHGWEPMCKSTFWEFRIYEALSIIWKTLSEVSKVFRLPKWAHCGSRTFFRFSSFVSIALPTPINNFSSFTYRTSEGGRTQLLIFPNIGLHTNTIIGMFSNEGQPYLYTLYVAILYLDQPSHGDSLEIFLTLLMDEVAARYSPSFHYSR